MFHQKQNVREYTDGKASGQCAVGPRTRLYLMPIEPPSEVDCRKFVAFKTKSAIRRLKGAWF